MRSLLLAALIAFCGTGADAQSMKMHHAAATTPADKAFVAAMDKMMQNMHATPTGDPDRDFVSGMIPHHQGAIDMAEVELKFGKDPQLLALARAIVSAQEQEIAQMRAWLKDHAK